MYLLVRIYFFVLFYLWHIVFPCLHFCRAAWTTGQLWTWSLRISCAELGWKTLSVSVYIYIEIHNYNIVTYSDPKRCRNLKPVTMFGRSYELVFFSGICFRLSMGFMLLRWVHQRVSGVLRERDTDENRWILVCQWPVYRTVPSNRPTWGALLSFWTMTETQNLGLSHSWMDRFKVKQVINWTIQNSVLTYLWHKVLDLDHQDSWTWLTTLGIEAARVGTGSEV